MQPFFIDIRKKYRLPYDTRVSYLLKQAALPRHQPPMLIAILKAKYHHPFATTVASQTTL